VVVGIGVVGVGVGVVGFGVVAGVVGDGVVDVIGGAVGAAKYMKTATTAMTTTASMIAV
jgi:hypothetical protein